MLTARSPLPTWPFCDYLQHLQSHWYRYKLGRVRVLYSAIVQSYQLLKLSLARSKRIVALLPFTNSKMVRPSHRS